MKSSGTSVSARSLKKSSQLVGLGERVNSPVEASLPNIHSGALESKLRRNPYRLTSTIEKELCNRNRHSLARNIRQRITRNYASMLHSTPPQLHLRPERRDRSQASFVADILGAVPAGRGRGHLTRCTSTRSFNWRSEVWPKQDRTATFPR